MFRQVSHFLSPLRALLGRPAPNLLPDRSRSVLLLRLENTGLLSDKLGKSALSYLIVRLSMALSRSIRPDDPVQIVAPGLFAVNLHDHSDRDAVQVAQRLQQQAQAPLTVSGRKVVPVLTGVLIHAEGQDLPEAADLLCAARQHLDDLSDSGLGLIHLHGFDAALSQASRTASVCDAAGAGQLVAHFQPQLCCDTGAVTGFEILARWNHPHRGLLLPAAFFGGMTDADHSALTLAMLDQGLHALKEWDRAGWTVPTVSLNISNCELADPAFATCLLWELDRHEIPPARLVIEVLESVGPVTSSAETRRNLTVLARAGCRIDLDDFGTGYASLDAIRQFGVQRIKIDRSFVTACDIDPAQQRMILAILALADRLGIAALAEGVETREEHAFLAQMGCDEVQGFAIAPPMPLAETTAFLNLHASEQPRLGHLLTGGQI